MAWRRWRRSSSSRAERRAAAIGAGEHLGERHVGRRRSGRASGALEVDDAQELIARAHRGGDLAADVVARGAVVGVGEDVRDELVSRLDAARPMMPTPISMTWNGLWYPATPTIDRRPVSSGRYTDTSVMSNSGDVVDDGLDDLADRPRPVESATIRCSAFELVDLGDLAGREPFGSMPLTAKAAVHGVDRAGRQEGDRRPDDEVDGGLVEQRMPGLRRVVEEKTVRTRQRGSRRRW